jgi:thioredoxin reductase
MTYDYDIIVVGAGPAGLSAALRARWLRTYKALPASLAVIDPSGLGGLANWKEVLVTGPSFKLDLANIVTDLERFPVEVVAAPVTGSALAGTIKTIRTPDRDFTCRAVIVCTGLKTLCNEREYVGRGLVMTLKDHAYMAEQLEAFCAAQAGARVLVWGTAPAARFLAYFEGLNRGRLRVTPFFESDPGDGPGTGRITRLDGADRLEYVEYRDPDGLARRLETDFVLLDFESLMLRTTSTRAFGELAGRDGFIAVDHELRTSVEGVFAAGDATGGPFCAAKAIGEGVTAGFAAYRRTFADKFGYEPPLYAFFPSHAARMEPEVTGFRLPELSDACCPKVLGRVSAVAGRLGLDAAGAALLSRMDGRTPLDRLQREADQDLLLHLIQQAVDAKALAIHV